MKTLRGFSLQLELKPPLPTGPGKVLLPHLEGRFTKAAVLLVFLTALHPIGPQTLPGTDMVLN